MALNFQAFPHLSHEENLFRNIVLNTVTTAELISQFVTWSLGAEAAISAVLIGNLEKINSVVGAGFIKTSFILLLVSLIVGAWVKQMGEALVFGVLRLQEYYTVIFSEAGKQLFAASKWDNERIADELAKWFWGPLGRYLSGSARKGGRDFLLTERRFAKAYCLFMYLAWAHILLGAISLLVLVFGLK